MQRFLMLNMVFMVAFAFTDRFSGANNLQDEISTLKMSQVRNKFIRKTKNGICPESCIRQKLEISLIDFLDELNLPFQGIAPFGNTMIDIGYCTGQCKKSQPRTIRQKLMDDNVSTLFLQEKNVIYFHEFLLNSSFQQNTRDLCVASGYKDLKIGKILVPNAIITGCQCTPISIC